jgi:excisionase family DNA binding protein
VRRLIQERRIPHFKVGSRVILSAKDCDEFLETARREARR